ncbi:MAG: hypothetical protein RBT15_04700 [Gudongella sp.]|jgi:hypothetical protein|nr:hypothetical protein [Gudongella sp.]
MKPNMLENALKQRMLEGYKTGYDRGYAEGLCNTVKNYSAVTLICLKDHFDFDTEQLKQIAAHINNYFDSVCLGLVTLDDVADALKEENNITISFDGTVLEGVKEYLNEETERRLLEGDSDLKPRGIVDEQ